MADLEFIPEKFVLELDRDEVDLILVFLKNTKLGKGDRFKEAAFRLCAAFEFLGGVDFDVEADFYIDEDEFGNPGNPVIVVEESQYDEILPEEIQDELDLAKEVVVGYDGDNVYITTTPDQCCGNCVKYDFTELNRVLQRDPNNIRNLDAALNEAIIKIDSMNMLIDRLLSGGCNGSCNGCSCNK